jgi:hypothetical protein
MLERHATGLGSRRHRGARSYMKGGCAMPANTERLIFAGDPAAREARTRMRRGSKTF